MPDAITYTEARKKLASTMDRVCDSHEPVIITRQKARPVVMISLEDFNSIAETAYLLDSPANAERLRMSIRSAEAGKLSTHELLDDEATDE
jgi:antitoxin YefM